MTYEEIAAGYEEVAERALEEAKKRAAEKERDFLDKYEIETALRLQQEAMHYRYLAAVRPIEQDGMAASRDWNRSGIEWHKENLEVSRRHAVAWERIAAALEALVSK